MKKKVEEFNYKENIETEALDDVMSDRYATYAKYVIQDRAIPDARDGLKPVQRRIIYSMFVGKNTSKNQRHKCARIVGDVIGKFHPHGDTSVYEALVRLSQDWKVRMPLIDFQGNNGSIDGDQAAAYRYTEARLAPLADELIRDLEKNTVDMALTFDDTQFEPTVLPARFPHLFVNGGEGIAVAMATEIPPHNLKEMIDAVIYRLIHVNADVDKLMQFVKGPDFPTGGIIYNTDGLRKIYDTGKGRIEIGSKTEIKFEGKTPFIYIYELPYKAVKKDVVFELDVLRKNKTIDGIVEVLDQSDRTGQRISIELKKDAKPEAILAYLNQKTSIKTSYSANIVAIVDGRPKTLTLLEYIDTYIKHQKEVETRRVQYDLKKSNSRVSIVNGLIKAISILDKIVATIRKSSDKSDAKKNIINEYGFLDDQAEAIVTMPLYKLTRTDVTTLQEEKRVLDENIREYNEILSDESKLIKVLIKSLKEVSKTYGNDRRTEIVEKGEAKIIDKRDLIAEEEVYVAVTRDGYVKRSSVKSYMSSEQVLPGMKEGDVLVYGQKCLTTDTLVCFTQKGNYFLLNVFDLFDGKWKDEGKHINSFISIDTNEEKIFKVFAIASFRKDLFFVLISKIGFIKRTPLSGFLVSKASKTFKAMNLGNNDLIADICFTRGNNNLLIFTETGEASLINENDLTPIGPKASGVKAVKKLTSKIATLLPIEQGDTSRIFYITNKGHYRIFNLSNIEISKRPGKLITIMRCFKSDIQKIVYATKVVKDDKNEMHFLFENSEKKNVKFILQEFESTPIDKYAKTNIKGFSKNVSLTGVFTFGYPPILFTTKSEYVEKIKPIKENEIFEINNNGEDEERDKKPLKNVSLFDEDDGSDNN